jgi:hypothetical protein
MTAVAGDWRTKPPCRGGVRLDARPLLRQIELLGGFAAVGAARDSAERRLLERAEREGYLSLEAADRIAVRLLHMPAISLWPDYGQR